MKAIAFKHVGGPEVLELLEVPKPSPGRGEVTIAVRACALNLLDYYLRIEADPEMPMPHILGSDISGDIDAVGDGVTEWHVGDAVVVSAAIEVAGGRPKIIGYQTQGGYAEFTAVPARNLARKPASLSYEEASSMPLVFATAYHQMFTRGGVRCGDVVLVMGGSGGVGSAAIQICRAAGAYVIATVGDDAKREAVLALGADRVVNHSGPQWTAEVLEMTMGRGVTLVCEHLGGGYVARCIEVLAHGGRLVTIGNTVGNEVQLNLSEVFRKEVSILGSYMGSHEEFVAALALVEMGRVRPIVNRVFKLEEAQEAHRYLESRKHVGKIILKIDRAVES